MRGYKVSSVVRHRVKSRIILKTSQIRNIKVGVILPKARANFISRPKISKIAKKKYVPYRFFLKKREKIN